MDDKVLVALVAAGSAIIGGLITAVIGPVIKHWLEERTDKNERRRAQIIKWRAMVLEVSKESEYINDVGQHLQLHPEFMSLEALLSPQVRSGLYQDNRTIVVGQSLPVPLEGVKNDIARIEKEWGLS